jgi:hypothetical protein
VPPLGQIASEVVVAAVAPAAPRLAAAPVAPGGRLRCGEPQWLGLLLAPLHGAPRRARLRLRPGRHVVLLGDPADAPAAADLLASGGSLQSREQQAVPLKQQVLVQALAPGGAGAAPQLDQTLAVGNSSGASEWVVMERGCLDLGLTGKAAGAKATGLSLQQPLLLWLQVLVGAPVGEPAAVRVQPAAAVAGRGGAAVAAAGGGAVEPGGGRWRAPWAAMELHVEYFDGEGVGFGGGGFSGLGSNAPQQTPSTQHTNPSRHPPPQNTTPHPTPGMWRSHNSSLEIPLRQPITAFLQAHQLPPAAAPGHHNAPATPGGGASASASGDASVALHLLLQADPACAVVVRNIQLAPQPGVQIHPAFPLPPPWLLPLSIEAGGSAGVTFVLQRARGGGGAFGGAEACSALTVTYALADGGPEAAAADCVVCEQLGGGAGLADGFKLTAGGLPPPPSGLPGRPDAAGAAAAAAAEPPRRVGGGTGGRRGECVLRLPFSLELESHQEKGQQRRPHVRVKLLGPQSVPQGAATTLTWQLTRVADAPGGSGGGAGGGGGGAAAGPAAAAGTDEFGGDEEEESEVVWYEVHYPNRGMAASAALGGGGGSTTAANGGSAAAGSSGAPTGAADGSDAGGGGGARRHGCVRLGRGAGATATVEATVVPWSLGVQEAPRLVLMGVPKSEQERVRDEGVFVFAPGAAAAAGSPSR